MINFPIISLLTSWFRRQSLAIAASGTIAEIVGDEVDRYELSLPTEIDITPEPNLLDVFQLALEEVPTGTWIVYHRGFAARGTRAAQFAMKEQQSGKVTLLQRRIKHGSSFQFEYIAVKRPEPRV